MDAKRNGNIVNCGKEGSHLVRATKKLTFGINFVYNDDRFGNSTLIQGIGGCSRKEIIESFLNQNNFKNYSMNCKATSYDTRSWTFERSISFETESEAIRFWSLCSIE